MPVLSHRLRILETETIKIQVRITDAHFDVFILDIEAPPPIFF